MADKWQTSGRQVGDKSRQVGTRETSGRQVRDKWETRGRQVGDKWEKSGGQGSKVPRFPEPCCVPIAKDGKIGIPLPCF